MSPVTHFPRQRADSTPILPGPTAPASPNSGLLFPLYLLPSSPFRRRRTSAKAFESPASGHKISSGDGARLPTPAASASAEEQLIAPRRANDRIPSSLRGATSTLKCSTCSADLCFTSQIISKGFNGRHGRAYLISPLITSYSSFLRPDPESLDQHSRRDIDPELSPSLTRTLFDDSCVMLPTQPEDPVLLRQTGGVALPNTFLHKPAQRRLITGEHTVADLACKICGRILGWKYVAASEEAQRYKVGKFIVEMGRVRTMTHWEGDESDEHDGGTQPLETAGNEFPCSESPAGVEGLLEEAEGDLAMVLQLFPVAQRDSRHKAELQVQKPSHPRAIPGEDIEFNSGDEDECEDLFTGVWSQSLARRRRRMKIMRGA